jgi:CRISP-associated protein Cas1
MIKRTIDISTDGTFVSLKDQQLVLEREKETVATIPVEDVGVLLITGRVTATTPALTAVAEAGGVVVLCGLDNMPVSVTLPLAANQTHTQRLRAQIEATKPTQKRLWTRIVRAKVLQQASRLEAGAREAERLKYLAGEVRSGDPSNVEAQAAKIYWRARFGDDFRRDPEGRAPNNLLNYGYAILRAATARAVCLAGLHPALGLSHSNKYNPFSLADDLMEPFRPFVDDAVLGLVADGKLTVDKEAKRALLEVLAVRVPYRAGSGPLLVSVQKSAHSLAKAIEENSDGVELPDPD